MKHFKLLGLSLFVLASGCRNPGDGTTDSGVLTEGNAAIAYLAIGGVT